MPNSKQHSDKADRNREFADYALGGTHNDWAAVSLFYAAVHLAERLRTLQPKAADQHSRNHDTRFTFLIRHHAEIYTAFKALYDASLMARYGTCLQFEKAFPGNLVADKLRDEYFVIIRKYVESCFTSDQ